MRSSTFCLLALFALFWAQRSVAQSTEYWDQARARQALQRSSTPYWEYGKPQPTRRPPVTLGHEMQRNARNRTYRQYQGTLNPSHPPGPSWQGRPSAQGSTHVFRPRYGSDRFGLDLTEEFRRNYRLRDDYTVRRTPSGRINIYDRTNRLTHYARPSLDGGYRVYDRDGRFQRRITPSLADTRD